MRGEARRSEVRPGDAWYGRARTAAGWHTPGFESLAATRGAARRGTARHGDAGRGRVRPGRARQRKGTVG
jgi:hypothetical protein